MESIGPWAGSASSCDSANDDHIRYNGRRPPYRRSTFGRLPIRFGPVGQLATDRRAGQGAWTTVYRARPVNSQSEKPAAYALKMIRHDRQDHPVAREMLAREARVAREVRHPHLITILESQLKRTPVFLVMPWLEGATLQAYTSGGRSLDPPLALWIARQTAEALEALDRAGWRHGDIKPGNIFLSPQGHVTLLDLGFARRRDERIEGPGLLAGSGHYLAPENASSRGRPDIRSDIYSLGVVLYQLLSGRLPIEGETLEQLVAEHKRTAPIHLRRAAPHVPPRAGRPGAADAGQGPAAPAAIAGGVGGGIGAVGDREFQRESGVKKRDN